MKEIIYVFADGERSVVPVDDALYERYRALRRGEENLARRERYHRDHSLDATPVELPDRSPDALARLVSRESDARLAEGLARLSEKQARRLRLVAAGLSFAAIARLEGTDPSSVRESVEAARRKMRKFLEEHPLD